MKAVESKNVTPVRSVTTSRKKELTVSWMVGSQNNLDEHLSGGWWSSVQAFFLVRRLSLLSSSFFFEGLFIDEFSAIALSSKISFLIFSGSFSLTMILCTVSFELAMLSSNSFFICTLSTMPVRSGPSFYSLFNIRIHRQSLVQDVSFNINPCQ